MEGVQITLLLFLTASVLLQFCAAFFALHLMRWSGRHLSWILISAALMLMAIRRAISFYHLFGGDVMHSQDLYAEAVAFLISLILVVGLFSLAPLFKRIYSQKATSGNNQEGLCSTKNCGLFENMISGVVVYRAVSKGRDFIIHDMNSAAERIDKIARQHVIGRRLLEVFPGVDEFGLLDVFRRVWKSGEPESFPLRYYQDGRIAGWRNNYVYRRPDGDVVAIYNDVSAQMKLQQEIEHREQKFRLLYERAPLPYQSIDRTGRILEVNPAWLALTGRKRSEAVGRNFSELLPKESRAVFHKSLRGISETEHQSGMQLKLWDRNGAAIDVQMDLHVVTAGESDANVLYCILHTEAPQHRSQREQDRQLLDKLAAERRALQQEKLSLFGELTGGMAHELNGPLMAARNAFDLMRESSSPSDRHYEFIEIASSHMACMAEMVDAMYRFHEPVPRNCEELNINAMLDNALLLLRKRIKDAGIQLIDRRSEKLPTVCLPPGAVMLVLVHPLRNCIDVLDNEGEIELRSGRTESGEIFVEIEDNGPGVPPDFISRLFDPFTTFRHMQSQPQGVGLGMAIVRRTLDALGGEIRIRSRIGEGTCVRIELPPEFDKKPVFME